MPYVLNFPRHQKRVIENLDNKHKINFQQKIMPKGSYDMLHRENSSHTLCKKKKKRPTDLKNKRSFSSVNHYCHETFPTSSQIRIRDPVCIVFEPETNRTTPDDLFNHLRIRRNIIRPKGFKQQEIDHTIHIMLLESLAGKNNLRKTLAV